MSSHKEMLFLLLLTHPDPACAHTAAQQRAGVRSAWPAPSTPGAGTPTPPRAPRCPRLFCQAERCHAQPSRRFCAHPPPAQPLRGWGQPHAAISSSRICISAKGTEALNSKIQQPSDPLYRTIKVLISIHIKQANKEKKNNTTNAFY